MVFPNNYLPSTSQPWGREVQKRIELAETAIARNEKNNDTRDTQLDAAMNRLSTTVLKSQEALGKVLTVEEQVYYPGTTEIDGGNIRANTIAANKISAGTLTGFTIQTASSGSRVMIGGDDITNVKFYDDDGAITGEVTANSSVLNLRNVKAGNGLWGTGSRSSLDLAGGSAALYVNDGSFNASLTMDPLGSTFTNGVTAPMLSAGFQGINTTGSVTAGSGITVGIGSTSGPVVINNPGGAIGNNYLQVPDTYVRNVQAGRIVYVSSAGTYNSASSSERYKQDITPYEVDFDTIMQLEPVSFRYKQAVTELGDEADIAHGFIAEQADAIGLTEFVDYEADENGNPRPDNFRYIDFTAALFSVIKKQQEQIDMLSARISALEE